MLIDEIPAAHNARRRAQVLAFIRANADPDGVFRLSDTRICRQARIPRRSVELALHDLFAEGALYSVHHVNGVAREIHVER